MKKFLKQVERNCATGALLLLPIVVFFVIIQKVWGFFQKYGDKFAQLLHLDEVFGTFTRDILGGLLLLIILYFSGYLMRMPFLKSFTEWVDEKLMIFLPGYEKSKKLAEEKLLSKSHKPKPHLPILIKQGNFWEPAHLIEENSNGNAVVFVPDAPEIDKGKVYVVSLENIKKLQQTTLEELNDAIKSHGKGMLNFK